MIELKNHFGTNERSRHSEWLRQRQWFIKAKHDRSHRQDLTQQQEETIIGLAAEAIAATQIQIREFEAKLDIYETATVEALEVNQLKLDEITKSLSDIELHIQFLLDRAYVMEDGRRVFLTENRTQAFDETGVEVNNNELDFDLVPESNPTWESLSGAFAQRDVLKQEFKALETERSDILDYQEKLDAARDKVADGDITTNELDDLDAELSDAMPPSVKAQIPGFDSKSNAPELRTNFETEADPAKPDGFSPVAVTRRLPAFDRMGQ